MLMADLPYHTEALKYTPPMRRVHHTSNDCIEGRHIEPQQRQAGTGDKPLCEHCAHLRTAPGLTDVQNSVDESRPKTRAGFLHS
jgi:hypothetical protein